MSLLMDALRRAEADKKAQEERAARAAGDEAPAADNGVVTRISPYSKSQDDTVQIDGRALQAAAATMADFDLRIDDNLDRSVSMTLPESLSLEPLDGPVAADGNDTDFLPMERGPDEDFEAAEYGGNVTFTSRVERREQTATLPNARGLSSDLDDYFDRSQTLSAPKDAAPGEDGTLEEVAAHTVAGAQTVFRAGERPRSGRVLTWVAALAICIVLGIAGLGVYYAGLNPAPHVVPSPAVARDVEKPPGELHAPGAPLGLPLNSDGTLARIDTRPPPEASSEEESAETVQGSAPVADDVAPPPAAAPAEAKPAAADALAARPREPQRPRAPRRAAPATQGHAASEEIASGEVRISRSQRPNRVDATLAEAYAAFQAGNLDEAAKLYERARALDPERRDTLLGLGALALKRGDLPRAYECYATVLKRNPDDPVASAALFNMTEADGEGGAARLRLLLDEHADAAYLHAALGNWYARRQRWPDAQQAYFDAARLEAGNPDYAFNLAVSLDHMGQGAAAVEYYRKSLAMRGARGAGFDAEAAQDRIAALSAPVGGSVP
jgi:tetratricopeptide (TPR) repeat protein